MKIYHSKFISDYLEENNYVFNKESSAVIIVDQKDGRYAEETSKIINLFEFQAVSSIESNVYTYDTSEKIKSMKRAFGKSGLHELKSKQCKKFNYLKDDCLYYIDQALISRIGDDLIDRMINLIELRHQIYIEVGSDVAKIENKTVFDGGFVTSGLIDNPVKILIGSSLEGFFFTVFFGTLNKIDKLLFLLKKEGATVEGFDSSRMRYETICLYPTPFLRSINDKIYSVA